MSYEKERGDFVGEPYSPPVEPLHVVEARRAVKREQEYLDSLLARECKHCKKPIPLYNNVCASCAMNWDP